MKKKLFGTILAAALVVAQAVSAFAADSATAMPGESTGSYQITAINSGDQFPDVPADVMNKILAVNGGTESLQSVADLAPGLASSLSGKTMVTPFFDLSPVSGGVQAAAGGYEVTLQVSSLTSGTTGVQALHYSTARNTWELVAPTSVDSANKQITLVFQDLSPVAIIADGGTVANNATGTSPKTGVASNWMALLGAGAVLAFVSVAVYRKSRVD